MKDAYGIAGSIAEQAISSIRTTYSYVGEHQTLHRFSCALKKSMKLGIKQGLTKGIADREHGDDLCSFGFPGLGWKCSCHSGK